MDQKLAILKLKSPNRQIPLLNCRIPSFGIPHWKIK